MSPANDSFYDELSRLNNELVNLQRQLAKKNAELTETLARVKRLEGILPVCMHCHKIRNDQESWERIDTYIQQHSDAQFSHSICPECLEKYYPDDEDE